jgi:hypothetical protein
MCPAIDRQRDRDEGAVPLVARRPPSAAFAALLLFALAARLPAQAPTAEDARLWEISTATSAERIEADIRTLVGFGTRHSLSRTDSDTEGIGAARRWIKAEFERISADCGGCLEVTLVSETFSGHPRIPEATQITSVVAIQRGTSDPDRYVMMSGDIDSRVSDPLNATDRSPGANDNASGLAGVIEAARVLSRHRFEGSIVYAALAGEEQGLFGGRTLAQRALDEGWRLEAVLNNDMIGNIHGIDGAIDNTTVRVFSEGTPANESDEARRRRRFTGGEVDGISRQLARYVDSIADRYFPTLDVMMIYRLDRFGRGGHHRPFNDVGFPGVRIMEVHEHYDRQHQDLRNEDGRHFGDTIEYVDFDYAAKVTALNATVLASLAWSPGAPRDVYISGAVAPSTKLEWAPPAGGSAPAGYRVYWRLTDAATWTHSRWVGDVPEHSFDGLVIDNYFFAVAAVSAGGHESAVVFPTPRPRTRTSR